MASEKDFLGSFRTNGLPVLLLFTVVGIIHSSIVMPGFVGGSGLFASAVSIFINGLPVLSMILAPIWLFGSFFWRGVELDEKLLLLIMTISIVQSIVFVVAEQEPIINYIYETSVNYILFSSLSAMIMTLGLGMAGYIGEKAEKIILKRALGI